MKNHKTKKMPIILENFIFCIENVFIFFILYEKHRGLSPVL